MKEKETRKDSSPKNTAPMIPSAFPDEIPFTRTDAPADVIPDEVPRRDGPGGE